MELPATSVADDGAVVVSFGILTGREATIAEVDRLARSLSTAGGREISIVSERTHTYGGAVETVIHMVVARSDVLATERLERLCELWARDCAADRSVVSL